MSFKSFRVAPGATAELKAAGLELRDRATGAPLAECTSTEVATIGAVLVGMRSSDPGRRVPGTRDGYTCARCGDGMRLAPSGQTLAAEGTPTWCIQCFFEHAQGVVA